MEASLLGLDELRAQRVTQLVRSGVYFLWNEDELVYIGQSTNMYARVAEHMRYGTIKGVPITSCTFIDSPYPQLLTLEQLYISALRPKVNGPRTV